MKPISVVPGWEYAGIIYSSKKLAEQARAKDNLLGYIYEYRKRPWGSIGMWAEDITSFIVKYRKEIKSVLDKLDNID